MDKREKGREKERKKVNRATSLAGSTTTTTRRTRTDTHRTGPLQAISDLFLLLLRWSYLNDRRFGSGPQMVDSCVSVCRRRRRHHHHHYVTQFADEPRDIRVDHS